MPRLGPMLVLTLAAVLCMSCVTPRIRPLDADQRRAVEVAEAFVAHSGYTAHAEGQPSDDVERFDSFDGGERLVDRQRDTLESHAYAIAFTERGNYLVLFHRTHGAPGFRAVWVKDGKAVEVIHATPKLDLMRVVLLPSNARRNGS